MKYTEKIILNWHDTDASRIVRAGRILTYLQELANRQCENCGLPLEKLRDEKGLGFILGSLSMKILKPLYAYEEIELSTWCKPTKGYTFCRYFEAKRNGEIVVKASTVWVLLDINQKNMVRASAVPYLDECFYYDEPIGDSEVPPRARISKDAELFEVGSRKIVYSDVDYNMHMNNTHYPDMLCDFLDEMTNGSKTFRIASMALSYLKESPLGATLTVFRSALSQDNLVQMQTKNSLGEVCLEASVELEEI